MFFIEKINIEKIDQIIINDEQLSHIKEWVAEKKFENIDFPFEEVVVIVKDMSWKGFNTKIDTGVYFKSNEDTITIKQFDPIDNKILLTCTIDDNFVETKNMKIESKYINYYKEEYFQKIGITLLLIVFDIFQYITKRERYIVETNIRKTIKKPTKKSSRKSKNKKNYRYIQSKITRYTISDSPTNNTFRNKKYTHSWRVRGHWRYYKSTGKKVWVNSYIKGEGQLKGSKYKIK